MASKDKQGQGKWAGFARVETLESVWKGWVKLDIPAEGFAERSKKALTWAGIEKGKVISGIGNRVTGEVRIITREATEEEVDKFGHNRMPVVIDWRY